LSKDVVFSYMKNSKHWANSAFFKLHNNEN